MKLNNVYKIFTAKKWNGVQEFTRNAFTDENGVLYATNGDVIFRKELNSEHAKNKVFSKDLLKKLKGTVTFAKDGVVSEGVMYPYSGSVEVENGATYLIINGEKHIAPYLSGMFHYYRSDADWVTDIEIEKLKLLTDCFEGSKISFDTTRDRYTVVYSEVLGEKGILS